jgi:DNA-binding NtrC family response regulator
LKEFRLKLAADTTVLVRGDMIIAADLGFIEEMQATAATPGDWKIRRPRAPILRKCALTRSCGNRAEAARLLGIHRHLLLYTKMKRYSLDPCDQNSAN